MKYFPKSLIPFELKAIIRNWPIGYLFHLRDELRVKNSNSLFFSQFGEDELIHKYLPEKEGFYIDIGAGRPIRGSNTYALYLRGWTGICVDPIKLNMNLFKSLRPKDSFMNILIGSESSLMNFWEFVPYEYSTVVEAVAEAVLTNPRVKLQRVRKVIVKPMFDFIPRLTPKNASLLTIDVEGYDFEVLKTNDWAKFRPRVICVEDLESYKGSNHSSELEAYLSIYGYECVSETIASRIYVARSYLESLESLES